MVEELDLTDQDVSAIAAMIDSEIRSHVPDWAPAEAWSPSDDSSIHSGEAAASSEVSSEIKDNGSLGMNKPSLSGSLMLERTASGRKYWFSSMKATDGNSLLPYSPSSLSNDPVVAEGGPSAESPQSPVRHCDNGENPTVEDENVERVSMPGDLGSDGVSRESEDDLHVGTGELVLVENPRSSANVGSKNVNRIIEKLEHLLLEQERELEELRRKHSEAILELLEGLSQDAREVVLTLCKLKAPDHRLWSSIN